MSKLSEKCRLLLKFVMGKTKKVSKRGEEQVNRRVGAVEQGGRAGTRSYVSSCPVAKNAGDWEG